jgi:hypothetical protein
MQQLIAAGDRICGSFFFFVERPTAVRKMEAIEHRPQVAKKNEAARRRLFLHLRRRKFFHGVQAQEHLLIKGGIARERYELVPRRREGVRMLEDLAG